MKILIIGISYFSKKLCTMMQSYDKSNTYKYLNTYKNFKDILLLIPYIIEANIVISIGGTIWCKNEIELSLLFKKKLIFFWIGTDVITAKSYFLNKSYKSKYIKAIFHYCECNWIQEELKEIGINAKILPFVSFENIPDIPTPFPSFFSLLTYIRPERPNFYGIDIVIELAKRLPEINIKIAGLQSLPYDIPKNITLIGWIENFSNEIKKCIAFIRIPEHDGLSFSVLETLIEGRYVFYKYNFPYSFYTPTYHDLEKKVITLYHEFIKGQLNINITGHDFVKTNYNEGIIMNNLIKELQILFKG